MDRIRGRGKTPLKELLFEEASVLAGTMLMGSGVSGSRPDEHDSTVTLATLVEKIAAYRDAFYKRLLGRLKGVHGERLRKEATALKQPFGGARQHFNHYLAHRRAQQLQHVHLAVLFARMGYVDAAERQVSVLPVAATRMNCEIQCWITVSHRSIDAGSLEGAVVGLGKIEDILHRGIECGAFVDPWNMLGFGAVQSVPLAGKQRPRSPARRPDRRGQGDPRALRPLGERSRRAGRTRDFRRRRRGCSGSATGGTGSARSR